MPLQNDFLKIIDLLWDIEQFNLWLPVHHGSLAYLLDGLSKTDEYQSIYDKLYNLAKSKDANEFAMFATLKIVELCKHDKRYSEKDLIDLNKRFTNQKRNYENKKMFGIAMIKEKYMPDWFFLIFPEYINAAKLKMEQDIINYCCSKENKSIEEAKAIFELLNQGTFDLLIEFHFYVKNNRFTSFYPIVDAGHTAKELSETLGLSPLNAYLYLRYLRKEPEKALAEYDVRRQAFLSKT